MAFEFIFPITLGLLLRILAFPQEEQLKLEIDAFEKKKIPAYCGLVPDYI